MQQSFAYILNQRPFRDNSVLVDIFTEDFGRICCVARPAKKRGKILKGSLEQFRYLKIQWMGKGDVQTLTESDERGRHTIPPSEMMLGLYLNELILLFTQPHNRQAELFSAYKYTLHKLGDPIINQQVLMRFEMYLLAILGFPLNNENTIPNTRYIFSEEFGLTPDKSQMLSDQFSNEQGHEKRALNSRKIYIHADLLLALHDIQNMQESHWKALRIFLDQVLFRLAPRAINTRKLLHI